MSGDPKLYRKPRQVPHGQHILSHWMPPPTVVHHIVPTIHAKWAEEQHQKLSPYGMRQTAYPDIKDETRPKWCLGFGCHSLETTGGLIRIIQFFAPVKYSYKEQLLSTKVQNSLLDWHSNHVVLIDTLRILRGCRSKLRVFQSHQLQREAEVMLTRSRWRRHLCCEAQQWGVWDLLDRFHRVCVIRSSSQQEEQIALVSRRKFWMVVDVVRRGEGKERGEGVDVRGVVSGLSDTWWCGSNHGIRVLLSHDHIQITKVFPPFTLEYTDY